MIVNNIDSQSIYSCESATKRAKYFEKQQLQMFFWLVSHSSNPLDLIN